MPAYPDLSVRPADWSGLQNAIGGLGDTLKQNRLLENRATYGQQFAADPQGAINNALANGDSDYASKLAAEKQRQEELGIQRQHLDISRGQLGVQQGQLANSQAQLKIAQDNAALTQANSKEELQKARAGRIAGVGQMIVDSQDPNQQKTLATSLYNHPDFKQHFDNYGVTDADPVALGKFIIAEHRGYVAPEKLSAGQELFNTNTGQMVAQNTWAKDAQSNDVARLQADFKARTGKDLPLEVAKQANRDMTAKSAAGYHVRLDDDGNIVQDGATAPGSPLDVRSRAVAVQEKRLDPNTVAGMAYAREGSKSNVKLDTQLNRLASVKDQIQQIRDLVGQEGTPERSTAESGTGWINNHIGKQYWGSTPVASFMGVAGSKIATLQDELAQYVQSSGSGSDTRAKKAYEVVGDLQNSQNIPTLLARLQGVEQTIESLQKVPHIDAGSGGPKASPGSQPAAPQADPNLHVNPQTGEKITWNGSAWVPAQ